MAKSFNFSYKKRTAWGWGVFLLLLAAFILANQFGGFVTLGFWSILVLALAAGFAIQCLVNMTFASLPIPIAAIYYILSQQESLNLPVVNLWPTLILATLLLTAGLHVLLPNRWFRKHKHRGETVEVSYSSDNDNNHQKHYRGAGNVEDVGTDNNPRISVKFGAASKYIHADALETAELECDFGALEVYFDNVTLSPNGAVIDVDCRFGGIEMHIPAEWYVINEVSSSFGGVDMHNRSNPQEEGAQVVRITGNVSLGGMDVKRI